jgi:hypothetical protein
MLICLPSWECLEPHLPVGICPKGTFGNMIDCRPTDEAAYQTVLDIAKKHYPSLVREIEKQKRLSKRASRTDSVTPLSR